jgi:hypothetical protein
MSATKAADVSEVLVLNPGGKTLDEMLTEHLGPVVDVRTGQVVDVYPWERERGIRTLGTSFPVHSLSRRVQPFVTTLNH